MTTQARHRNMIVSALCLALAYLLPYVTGNIPQIGMMLLPMHLPVLVCGLICSPFWGATVGASVVILRATLTGMPPLFPMGIPMLFELAVYGAVTGLLIRKFSHNLKGIYFSLVPAMIAGRIVFGIVFFLLTMQSPNPLTLSGFIAMTVTSGIPGIIAQLVFIPPIVLAIQRGRMSDISWL